jgi:TPR repeat protein
MEHIALSTTVASVSSSAVAEMAPRAFSRSVQRLAARSRALTGIGVMCVSAFALLSVAGARASSASAGALDGAEVTGAPAALAALEGACNAGDGVACNDLGVSYEHGYSVERDSRPAAVLFERACAGGVADGCSNLGALHERGAGVPASLDAARELYQRACQQHSALGCSNLGALYARGAGTVIDRDEARRLFAQACAGGSATGCANLEASIGR